LGIKTLDPKGSLVDTLVNWQYNTYLHTLRSRDD